MGIATIYSVNTLVVNNKVKSKVVKAIDKGDCIEYIIETNIGLTYKRTVTKKNQRLEWSIFIPLTNNTRFEYLDNKDNLFITLDDIFFDEHILNNTLPELTLI